MNVPLPDELLKIFNEIGRDAVESGTVSFEDAAEAGLGAILPPYEQMVRQDHDQQLRASIIKGIKHYFAASEPALYDDVVTLCGRIERGEYGRVTAVRGETRE